MKNILFLLLLSGFYLHSTNLVAQEDALITDYIERLENSKTYILLVAKTMPESGYTFKPTPDSMSFQEHLMHIAWAMDWHSQSLMGGRDARDWNTDFELQVADKSKQEMIQKIEETFTKTIQFISSFEVHKLNERLDYFGANRTKRQILLLLADHITHHRAQMLVHMRLNGLKPPRYVLYQ